MNELSLIFGFYRSEMVFAEFSVGWIRTKVSFGSLLWLNCVNSNEFTTHKVLYSMEYCPFQVFNWTKNIRLRASDISMRMFGGSQYDVSLGLLQEHFWAWHIFRLSASFKCFSLQTGQFWVEKNLSEEVSHEALNIISDRHEIDISEMCKVQLYGQFIKVFVCFVRSSNSSISVLDDHSYEG